RTSMAGPPGAKLSSRLVKERKAVPVGPEAVTAGGGRVGWVGSKGRNALPEGKGMLARGGGARKLPPLQLARNAASARVNDRVDTERFMWTSCAWQMCDGEGLAGATAGKRSGARSGPARSPGTRPPGAGTGRDPAAYGRRARCGLRGRPRVGQPRAHPRLRIQLVKVQIAIARPEDAGRGGERMGLPTQAGVDRQSPLGAQIWIRLRRARVEIQFREGGRAEGDSSASSHLEGFDSGAQKGSRAGAQART